MVLGLLVVEHDGCQRIACRSTSDRVFLGQTAIDDHLRAPPHTTLTADGEVRKQQGNGAAAV